MVQASEFWLIIGFVVPLFFNTLIQGQDDVIFFLALAGFAACILYGEVNFTLASGVAFGIGMLPLSFAAQDWWLVGLAIVAVITSLTKYALSDSDSIGLDGLGSSIQPTEPTEG